MKSCFKNKRFLNIFLLISLVGFLVLPKNALADDFENIKSEELSKYLELPEKDANKLMDTLRQVFTTEGIFLWSSGDATEEKIAVAVTLLKVAKMQALSHLLVDAPLEMTQKIIKVGIDIVQIYINPAVFWEKFEKLTVQKAIEEGKRQLFQNEIRVTPGAIKFKYYSYKGGEKEIILQYVMIYKPERNEKRAEVVIRFYMPNSIEAPDAEKYKKGITSLPVPDLRKDLSPFIVEIKGIVKKDEFDNYLWINEKGEMSHPSVNITFPPTVPDLGIKPLSLWEKYVLKPIESKIKEIEIIITKVTGKSLNLVEIWNGIKSFFSKINPFKPAAIVQTLEGGAFTDLSEELIEEKVSDTNPKEAKNELESKGGPEPTLEEIQEILDDIAERIDILSQEAAQLLSGQGVIVQQDEETVTPEVEGISEEIEEIEEIIEEIDQTIERSLCQKTGNPPAREKIIINEVAWMGTVNSSDDEWVELKNISENAVNLSGWQLLDKDNQIKIIFSGGDPVSANGFYLLERTDDYSVSDVAADLIYSGGLGNTNEALYLFDENCQLQDEVSTGSGWPAGDNVSKRTMERKYDLTWQTSFNPGGTPRRENSWGYYGDSGGAAATGGAPPTYCSQENLSPPTYFPVIINEIAWMGTQTSSTDEWFELKNISDSEVNLSGWQLLDKDNQIKIIFSGGDQISANGFYLLERTDDESVPNISADKIYTNTLNDNEESLRLFDQNCDLIDEAIANPDWPAGNKDERKTMERTDGLTWHTFAGEAQDGIFGTPKTENSQPPEAPPEEPEEPEQPPLPQTIIINEIAWMGTSAESNDEWIELYNNTDEDVNLENWTLKAADGLPEINLSGTIPVNDFYLLERTSDNTISDIEVNQIYTGALHDEGEKLELKDKDDNVIDSVDCSENWFAGDKEGEITMERVNPQASGSSPDNWANNNQITRNGLDANGNEINGTPKAKNSVYQSLPPEAITNLQIQELADFQIELTWSAPNDPDTLPQNLKYDIRYLRNQEINEENWDSTTQLENEPPVASAGELQTFTISDLNYQTLYYFAIKTFDGGNYSSLSNIVFYQTSPAPAPFPWQMYQGNPQHTGQSLFSGPGASLDPKFGFLIETQISDDQSYFWSPVIGADGIIYFTHSFKENGESKGGLYAVSPDGQEKWVYTLPWVTTSPALGPDGALYLVLLKEESSILVVNRDGTKKWEKSFAGFSPKKNLTIASDGTIYLQTDSNLTAFNLDNGEIVWEFKTGETDFDMNLSPVVGQEGNIYFSHNKTLYALSSQGNRIWQRDFDYQIKTPSIGLDGTIYLIESGVKVGFNYLNCLHALNLQGGEEKWNICNFHGLGPPSISPEGNVFIAGGLNPAGTWKTIIYGYDNQGNQLENWPYEEEGVGAVDLLLIDENGIIYAKFGSTTLKALNKNGQQIWSKYLVEPGKDLIVDSISMSQEGIIYVPGSKKIYTVAP